MTRQIKILPASSLLAPFLSVLVLLSVWEAPAQTPPPHPRLLFTSADLPGLQARTGIAGSPWAQSYAQLATSTSLQTTVALPSLTGQGNWNFQRSLRRMTEVAFRYCLTGNVATGNDAKSALLSAVSLLTPTGNTPYQYATYAGAIAVTYDMVYPLLSAAERATVTSHLLSWVAGFQSGANPSGSFSSYAGATDNWSFAWCAGITLSLLAVWGDTSYPNIVPTIQSNLAKIRDGWNDAISPDGSIDESYGYGNYGILYSMLPALAALNCGLGDYVAGSNLPRVARWAGSSVLGSSFPWMGDSSPSHKGLNMDPVLYYSLKRANDAEAFFALERLYAIQPISDNSATGAFSPYLHRVLFYPHTFVPQPPAVLSAFYRDNLNQGTPAGNKTTNYPQIGLGGHAILQNAPSPLSTQLAGVYLTKDEWHNHGHEDDGHLGLVSEGVPFFLDLGYAGSTYGNAQSTSHNIVLVQGLMGFGGDNNNYYNPPSPNGRFLGRRVASLLGRTVDYVHGDHANMWMMERADRFVVMIKDPVRPFLIVADAVKKDANPATYEEVFHSGGPAAGAGTVASPMLTTASGRTLRSVWIEPTGITVIPGPAATAPASNVAYWRHRVVKTGTALSFVSVHGRDPVTSSGALTTPLPETGGGTFGWPNGITDRVIVKRGPAATVGDRDTLSDAAFVWLRSPSGSFAEWMLAEGTFLVHAGVAVFGSNAPVVISSRQGFVEIQTLPVGTPVPVLQVTAFAPFPVTQVLVNAAPVAFLQTGNYVTLGSMPPFPPPSNDRCTTFTGGFLGDFDVGANFLVTDDGRMTSSTGWCSAGIKHTSLLAARPMALGMDVNFSVQASGPCAGFRIEGIIGTGDIASIDASPAGVGSFTVSVATPAGTLASIPMPLNLANSGGRFEVVYLPQTGQVQILDPLGIQRGSAQLPPRTAGVYARAVCTPTAFVDNLTWFDSEEDGVNPQGVAFWGLPNGRIGCALRAAGVGVGSAWTFYYQGSFLPASFTNVIISLAGITERAATPYMPATAAIPSSLATLVFESLVPAVNPVAGGTVGLRFSTPTGVQLLGTWGF